MHNYRKFVAAHRHEILNFSLVNLYNIDGRNIKTRQLNAHQFKVHLSIFNYKPGKDFDSLTMLSYDCSAVNSNE